MDDKGENTLIQKEPLKGTNGPNKRGDLRLANKLWIIP